MRLLEEAVIQTLQEFGIKSGRINGFTWCVGSIPRTKKQARKICALGVKTSRWVTMHGLAFNVNANPNYFANIVPCGIADKTVTSFEKELGKAQDLELVKTALKEAGRYF